MIAPAAAPWQACSTRMARVRTTAATPRPPRRTAAKTQIPLTRHKRFQGESPMFSRVQYPESIEPLVQFIEETPRDQILDKTLAKLRDGVDIETDRTRCHPRHTQRRLHPGARPQRRPPGPPRRTANLRPVWPRDQRGIVPQSLGRSQPRRHGGPGVHPVGRMHRYCRRCFGPE